MDLACSGGRRPVVGRQAPGDQGLTPNVPAEALPREKPRVSVIIVSRNRRELLQRSLEALGTAHQVIVVDNGSSDGAAALEGEFRSARFIRLPKNFGLTKALNLGIRSAEGEYLLFLHDDVCISGTDVSILADILDSNPEAGAVCPKFDGVNQVASLPTPAHPYPDWHTAGTSDFEDVECAMGAAIMVRQRFIQAMRQIDERYGNYGSDIDLCAQVVKRANKKIRIACNVKALHDVLGKDDALLEADRVIGTAVFLGKYYGFRAGMKFRIARTLQSVFGFRWGMAKHLLSNQKLDGTHT
jgi:N-acetylglucosaminyl-diphospho-decaprenol L-rhamnosyltransferase